MKDFKVGIIGVGHVGAHVLQTIALQGLAEDIIIVDLPDKRVKAESERQDVLDCMEFLPHKVKIEIGEVEDLGDRDVIVNCVGDILALKGTHTRLTELTFNMKAIDSYAHRLRDSGFKGILVNISNPCDVVSKWFNDILALPKGHVIGTGTGLDTARLKLRLQEATGIDAKSITAYMLGEHGNDQFSAWSACSLGGLSLKDSKYSFDLDKMEASAREGGWTTYNGKFCTEYAIAMTAAKLVRLIRFDEKAIVSVSAELTGEYGESGLYAGVPARIGRGGAEEVIELSLTDKEKERFHKCCDGIRNNLAAAKDI